MQTNIHLHLFSADHVPSAQLYFLLRGALHGAARRYLKYVRDSTGPITAEELQKFDRSLDRFDWPWPRVFSLAIEASRLAGSVGLINPARLIDMFVTVARLKREELWPILRLDAREKESAFLQGLIARTEAEKKKHSPVPFRNALCAMVSELYAVHEANVKVLGRVTHEEIWKKFTSVPGADKYTRIIVLSVNTDKAFLQETLPGLSNRPALGFRAQADELESLCARVNARPGVQLMPFLGVEPRGYEAEELLEFVRNRIGADKVWKGLKFYPSMGFHPNDERLMQVFDLCQDESIPVLAHCSHGGAGVRGSERNFGDYSSPEEWEAVLDRLSRRNSAGMFKLCLAHFDSLECPLDSPDALSWSNAIIQKMTRYDGSKGVEVYTDVAFDVISSAGQRDIYGANVQRVKDMGLVDRVLFGSDWWMYIYECSDEERFVSQLNVDEGWWNEADFETAAANFLGDP
jgi:predicted TIM-barrel fold metal-dependent hydrolase